MNQCTLNVSMALAKMMCVSTALILGGCAIQPPEDNAAAATPWGAASQGLQARIFLDRFNPNPKDDRGALCFELKNVSDHEIVIPVWWLDDKYDPAGKAMSSHPVLKLDLHVNGYPEVRTVIGRGAMPPLSRRLLHPGETFVYFYISRDYGVATGQWVDKKWTKATLPQELVAVFATYSGEGSFDTGLDTGVAPESAGFPSGLVAVPSWKGTIQSNTLLMRLGG